MKPLRLPLRAVLYREGDLWIAHCLEMDLLGDGPDQEKALNSLSQAIVTQLQACIKHDNVAGIFCPAEAKYFRMFAAGKDAVVGAPRIEAPTELDDLTIERVEAREYSEADSDSDLVPA